MQSNRNRKSKRWSRKNTTCVNLGIGLAREGKKVLLVEADAQGSMAVSLGIKHLEMMEQYIRKYQLVKCKVKIQREWEFSYDLFNTR